MADKINPNYRKKIEDIKVEGEDFADSAMKDVYLEQKEALDEVHNMVGKIYINYAAAGLLVLTSAQKSQIIANVKNTLKEMGQKLGKSEIDKVTAILGNVFKDTYYQNAYIMESGLKVELKFNILKQEFINSAVNKEFIGEMFSDRIWTNKAEMIDKLQLSIIEAMKGNVHLDKVGRDIRDTFNVTAYESQRLVRTETARIQTQATYDIAKSTGVKQQMYSATLDMKTNPKDAIYDGKIYDIDDPDKPSIPMHPNCRCCWINVPYDGWSPTARKDNESKKIIDYKDYESWSKAKGIEK